MFKEETEEQAIAKRDWLNDRKAGIGGSDIGTILGLNAYKSPLQLWVEKTGRSDENVDNNFTRAGVKMEPMVADWFQEETGLQLINPGNVVTRHAIHPWVLGTPDREAINVKLNKKGILEIKTTGHTIDKDNIPLMWFCQVMWYAGIYKSHPIYKDDMDNNFISWFERMTCAFEYTELKYDPEFFLYLIEQAGLFWENYVLKDTPPPAKSADDVKTLYQKHTPGKIIMASPEMVSTIIEYAETAKYLKAQKDQAERLKLEIQLIMQDAETIYVDGHPAVTWKTSKDSVVFDEERFQRENPVLYATYLATTPGSRRFLLKK